MNNKEERKKLLNEITSRGTGTDHEFMDMLQGRIKQDDENPFQYNILSPALKRAINSEPDIIRVLKSCCIAMNKQYNLFRDEAAMALEKAKESKP